MLKLYYAHPHMIEDEAKAKGWRVAEYPGAFFDSFWEESWFEDELFVRVLNDIEQLPVKHGSVLIDMAYECRHPEILSNGVKNLFLARNTDNLILLLSKIGDNCFKYLFEIAKDKDVYICANMGLYVKESDLNGVEIHVLNWDRMVASLTELADFNIKARTEILTPNSPWK